MKKILIGALAALMVMSFGTLTQAAQADYDNTCHRGNYCYTQDGDNCDGDYGYGHGRGGYGCYR